MSSILDALNKRPGNRATSAGPERLDKVHPQGRRRGGSGASPLRIALWVVSTVAVGAFTGLFLVYRLAALGLAAKNPLEGLTVAESLQGSEASSPAPLKDKPAASALSGLTTPDTAPERTSPVPPQRAEPSSLSQAEPIALPETVVHTAAEAHQAAETWAEAAKGAIATTAEAAATAEAIELHLKGIMLNAERPMAIINGRLVGVGEQVEGRKVLAISRDGVRLEGRAALLRIHE